MFRVTKKPQESPQTPLAKGFLSLPQSGHEGQMDLDSDTKMLPKSHLGCLRCSGNFVLGRFDYGMKRHLPSPAMCSACAGDGRGICHHLHEVIVLKAPWFWGHGTEKCMEPVALKAAVANFELFHLIFLFILFHSEPQVLSYLSHGHEGDGHMCWQLRYP